MLNQRGTPAVRDPPPLLKLTWVGVPKRDDLGGPKLTLEGFRPEERG